MNKKKKPLLPEEEDSIRANTNPFEKEDEKDGVDLKDDDSPRNSFLDDEDLDDPLLEDDEGIEHEDLDELW